MGIELRKMPNYYKESKENIRSYCKIFCEDIIKKYSNIEELDKLK